MSDRREERAERATEAEQVDEFVRTRLGVEPPDRQALDRAAQLGLIEGEQVGGEAMDEDEEARLIAAAIGPAEAPPGWLELR